MMCGYNPEYVLILGHRKLLLCVIVLNRVPWVFVVVNWFLDCAI